MGADNSDSSKEKRVLKKDFLDKKDRWELLPIEEVKEIVEILTIGAENYFDNSWKQLENGVDRYYAALMRHLCAWRSGQAIDDGVHGTGKRHIAQVAVNALFLMYLTKNNKTVEPNVKPIITNQEEAEDNQTPDAEKELLIKRMKENLMSEYVALGEVTKCAVKCETDIGRAKAMEFVNKRRLIIAELETKIKKMTEYNV